MLKAITRAVSRNITRCKLTFKQRESSDYEKAASQQASYCALLTRCAAEAHASRTLELVGRHCREVEVLYISKFRKSDGSLPCLSILFQNTCADNHSNQNKEVMYAE